MGIFESLVSTWCHSHDSTFSLFLKLLFSARSLQPSLDSTSESSRLKHTLHETSSPTSDQYMAANFTFRGNLSTQEVDDNMEKLNSKNADDFVEWIPNNLKTGVITTAPKTSNMSTTFIANTTALKGIFQRLATQFGAMYRRKAFLHWYKGEGMDEMEFQEADKNVRD